MKEKNNGFDLRKYFRNLIKPKKLSKLERIEKYQPSWMYRNE